MLGLILRRAALAATLCGAAALPTYAATITDGFTFAVASACGSPASGSHFHSSTAGDFGNPAGKAEVGSFNGASCEEVRGLSEYNLAGLATTTSAFVTFDVFDDGGLFPGTNDFAYLGDIQVIAYGGNNLEDVSDYQAASIGVVGTFSTIGLGVGGILSFDITDIFNDAIDASDASLGIRLQIAGAPNGGAFTFDKFRLTTTDDTTPDVVPLPGAGILFLGALAGLGLLRRRA